MATQTITLTFEIPEFIDKNKFKKELENFIKKKILGEKFYKLMEKVQMLKKLKKNVKNLEKNSNSEIEFYEEGEDDK